MEKHRCDDCGTEFTEEELENAGKTLADIRHLLQRVDGGGIVPSGECPECGALCYPVNYKFVRREVEDQLRKVVEAYDATDDRCAIPLREVIEEARKLLDSYA